MHIKYKLILNCLGPMAFRNIHADIISLKIDSLVVASLAQVRARLVNLLIATDLDRTSLSTDVFSLLTGESFISCTFAVSSSAGVLGSLVFGLSFWSHSGHAVLTSDFSDIHSFVVLLVLQDFVIRAARCSLPLKLTISV